MVTRNVILSKAKNLEKEGGTTKLKTYTFPGDPL